MLKENWKEISFAGLILIALVGTIIFQESNKAEALGSFSTATSYAIAGATTTPVFIGLAGQQYTNMLALGVATTSLSGFDIDGAERVFIDMAYVGTSTTAINPIVAFSFESSYDGVQYYTEDLTTVSGGTTTHNAGTASSTAPSIHTWTPITATTTVYKRVEVPANVVLGAKYLKINLASWVDNSHWWGEIIRVKSY